MKHSTLKVFISYSRKNMDFVERLIDSLEPHGFQAWIDRRKLEGGQVFDREIRNAIDDADAMLVVLSQDAVDSMWVRKEWQYAKKQKKLVIPLIYFPCRIPRGLTRLHYIDFVGGVAFEEHYQAGLDLLLTALRGHQALLERREKESGKPEPTLRNRALGYPNTLRRRRSVLALNLLLYLVIASAFLITGSRLFPIVIGARSVSTPTPVPTSTPNDYLLALIPAGPVLYGTRVPGKCDSLGGGWEQNPYAAQQCNGDGLVVAGPDCYGCPLGLVAIASMPGHLYPINFVAQVILQPQSTGTTGMFGVKFRQQTAQNDDKRRGGYSFLFAQGGDWQFNRYDADGTRSILAQGTLSFHLSSSTTLDVAVSGSNFSVYLNSRLVVQRADPTYKTGFFSLSVGPFEKAIFRDTVIYTPA
jgi:hypothetical protein